MIHSQYTVFFSHCQNSFQILPGMDGQETVETQALYIKEILNKPDVIDNSEYPLFLAVGKLKGRCPCVLSTN